MRKILLGLILCLTACTAAPQEPVAVKDQGRPETKKLEGASAVGYDGKAVRGAVDSTLNKNDDHNSNMNKQLEDVKQGEKP